MPRRGIRGVCDVFVTAIGGAIAVGEGRVLHGDACLGRDCLVWIGICCQFFKEGYLVALE